MTFLLLCISSLLWMSCAATDADAAAVPSAEALLTLTSANFSLTTATGDWFFLFHADYEGHSKRFMPVFKRLATHLKNLESPVRLARVECVKNAGVCQAFNIYAYPTIKFKSEDGDVIEYKGKREIDDMKAFVFVHNPARNAERERELEQRRAAKKAAATKQQPHTEL